VSAMWQPIETAPMDGEEVLVATGRGARYVALWNGTEWTDGSGQRIAAVWWQELPFPPITGNVETGTFTSWGNVKFVARARPKDNQ
jgi:hypothetical protein